MASFFSRLLGNRIALITAGTGAAGLTAATIQSQRNKKDSGLVSAADEQFHTSSRFLPPVGWTGPVWKIRNDYPKPDQSVSVATNGRRLPPVGMPGLPPPGVQEFPWLNIDFTKEPEKYCQIIKEYCWEGNVENEFVVQKNKIRDWYHAPWMHWSTNGRECLNGLTFERSIQPGEFSATQNRYLQNWACGYYNSVGAATFGEVWADPSAPNWDTDVKFKQGTCVFKVLLTDATNEEVPSMQGSPSLHAVVAQTPADPKKAPDASIRNTFASKLRLIQVDFAVVDERSPIGWVFGTFMYDGSHGKTNAWDNIIPVGLMWGNDPRLNQAAAVAGEKPTESWINPMATKLRESLGGFRPFWGWNGRLNGPADNFMSACASCHSLAQKTGESSMIPPGISLDKTTGTWVPKDDKKVMDWFRNIPAGTPFTPGAISGDYSLQLMIGFHNYQNWRNPAHTTLQKIFSRSKYIVGLDDSYGLGGVDKREGLRQGPEIERPSNK